MSSLAFLLETLHFLSESIHLPEMRNHDEKEFREKHDKNHDGKLDLVSKMLFSDNSDNQCFQMNGKGVYC